MTILTALLVMTVLAILIGLALEFISKKYQPETSPIFDEVISVLPQTQCAQCGYPGCKPYAEAIINDFEAINRCPPGGQETIEKLASILGQEPIPLDTSCGETKPEQLAIIDEEACIGCVKCIKACPVDAISGAAKKMHTIINDLCTGCELCIEPCPVDCITMYDVPTSLENWRFPEPKEKEPGNAS